MSEAVDKPSTPEAHVTLDIGEPIEAVTREEPELAIVVVDGETE